MRQLGAQFGHRRGWVRSPAMSSRDPWLDNAKMMLVTLVVIGHAWTLLPDGALHDQLYDFVYAWHMPAFVFVTGYLSRSFDWTGPRLWQLVRTVLVPYVLFECQLALFRTYVGGENAQRPLPRSALAGLVPRGGLLLADGDPGLPPAPRLGRSCGRWPPRSASAVASSPSSTRSTSTSRGCSVSSRSSCSVWLPRPNASSCSGGPAPGRSRWPCSSRRWSRLVPWTPSPAPTGSTTAATTPSGPVVWTPFSCGAVCCSSASRAPRRSWRWCRASAGGSPGWARPRWSSTCSTASS